MHCDGMPPQISQIQPHDKIFIEKFITMLNRTLLCAALLLFVCIASALDLRGQVGATSTPKPTNSFENAQDQFLALEDALKSIPVQIIEWIDSNLASILNIMSAAVPSGLHIDGGSSLASVSATDSTSRIPGYTTSAGPSATANYSIFSSLVFGIRG